MKHRSHPIWVITRLCRPYAVICYQAVVGAIGSVHKENNQSLNSSISEGASNSNSKHNLVKSKQRVADHGEVFTPSWLVDDMLNLVKNETERIDSRFLEPACGSGNFLKVVLDKKLKVVHQKYGKSEFECKHHALLSLMCIYGIELLEDNVKECREILLSQFIDFLKIDKDDLFATAAELVLNTNIIQGDALTLTKINGTPIEFPEWGYLGNGKYQRRDFRYDDLTQRSSITGTLFEILEEHEVFIPTKSYSSMTVKEMVS